MDKERKSKIKGRPTKARALVRKVEVVSTRDRVRKIEKILTGFKEE